MPEIAIQKQPAALGNLEVCESFGEPIGNPSLQTAAGFYEGKSYDGDFYTGTWECEPGLMALDLDLTEFCHLLEGHWRITSDTGVVTELRAGDSWVFPRGLKGQSEVLERVRKVYCMMVPEEG